MRSKNAPWAFIGLFALPLFVFFPSILTGIMLLFSPIALIPWGINLIREYRTSWIKVTCPWCGQVFETEPQDTLVYHARCGQQVVLRNGGQTRSIPWLKSKINFSHEPWIADLVYTSDKGLEV